MELEDKFDGLETDADDAPHQRPHKWDHEELEAKRPNGALYPPDEGLSVSKKGEETLDVGKLLERYVRYPTERQEGE